MSTRSWIRRLFARAVRGSLTSRRGAHTPDLRRPCLEVLEDRRLLSVSYFTPAMIQTAYSINSLIAAGDTSDGVSQLQSFINHVSAQCGKHVAAGLGNAWVADAQRIIDAVG